MAILGIWNKPAYYTEKDAEIVSYLADVAWEITRRKKAEEAAGKYAKDLKERLKEINCLYSISEIVQKKDITQEELFKECPSIIAQAYQFPEITVCRILIGDHEYRTDNFRQTQWSQSKTIKVNGEPVGLVEVCYLEERRKEYEGPFLVEERNLLEAFAGILERYLEGKEAQDALRTSEEKYKQLVEVFPETIFETNMKGDITYANPYGLNQFGFTEDDIAKGINIFDHVSPNDRELLIDRIQSRINGDNKGYFEYHALKKDGSPFHALALSVPIIVEGMVVGIRGFILDITERKQAEEQIKHMATHDSLTDLPSLRLAKDRLSSALNVARRYKKAAAVMFIDLDGFKNVNDNLGHDAGDYVLKQVAQRPLSCVRETDTVARIGGDEFLIIATEINHPDNAAQIAEKVIHTVSQPIAINGEHAMVGTSIGIALFPDHGDDIDKIIKLADEAMYKVKNAGKNNFCFVTNSI
jgi:diguanylate cyclase (GGDEF)-like protein/PAS domain S-box-containing protein